MSNNLINVKFPPWKDSLWRNANVRKVSGPGIFQGTSIDTSTDVSIDTRSTLDRHATNMSIHCRLRVDRCCGRASIDVGRRIDRDHIGRLSVNYRRDIGQLSANMSTDTMVPIDVSADIMGHNNSKTPNKISIFLSYKYYRPINREIYWPMSRPLYRPMSRPIYRPIYSVKYRYTIGEASVKYQWTPYRPIGVSVDTQLIYQPSIDRYTLET